MSIHILPKCDPKSAKWDTTNTISQTKIMSCVCPAPRTLNTLGIRSPTKLTVFLRVRMQNMPLAHHIFVAIFWNFISFHFENWNFFPPSRIDLLRNLATGVERNVNERPFLLCFPKKIFSVKRAVFYKTRLKCLGAWHKTNYFMFLRVIQLL